MSKEAKDFEISKLLKITESDKYANTVAAFEIIDYLEQLDVPKKYQHRKPSIQAMATLSEKVVQWDFISDEDRHALEDELRASRKAPSALDSVFGPETGAAPISDDSDEDLNEIVDTGDGDAMADFQDDNDDSDEDFDDEESSDDDISEEEYVSDPSSVNGDTNESESAIIDDDSGQVNTQDFMDQDSEEEDDDSDEDDNEDLNDEEDSDDEDDNEDLNDEEDSDNEDLNDEEDSDDEDDNEDLNDEEELEEDKNDEDDEMD